MYQVLSINSSYKIDIINIDNNNNRAEHMPYTMQSSRQIAVNKNLLLSRISWSSGTHKEIVVTIEQMNDRLNVKS